MDRRVLAFVVAVCGIAITALFLFPGYHNGDTNWQYWQALTGITSSWHPVVMAFVWRLLDHVIPGTGGLFLLNATIFWASWALLAEGFSRTRAGMLALGAVPVVCAPVFALLGQVPKDTGMGVAMLLGFASLERADRRRSPAFLALGLVALWYAIALRHNGVFAVLPFSLAIGTLLAGVLPSAAARRLGRTGQAALGLAAVAGLVAASEGATRLILEPGGQRVHLEQQVLAHDLIGISVRTGHSYLPQGVFRPDEAPFTLDELRRIYEPYSASALFWGPPGPRRLLPPDPRTRWVRPVGAEATLELARAWLDAVRHEPRAYLAHRLELFQAQLGMLPGTPLSLITVRPPQSPSFAYLGPTVFEFPHHRWLVHWVDQLKRTVWLAPWPYLLLTLLWMIAAGRGGSRHRRWLVLLGASALLHAGALAFVGVHAGARYLWWPMVAAVTGASLLGVEVIEARLSPASSEGRPSA